MGGQGCDDRDQCLGFWYDGVLDQVMGLQRLQVHFHPFADIRLQIGKKVCKIKKLKSVN